jgi:hypothetical protein
VTRRAKSHTEAAGLSLTLYHASMPRPATGVALILGLGTAITIAIAWPVVTHPSHLIFGDEIIGRHYDAYTVMQQMAGGVSAGPYAQPLTDRAGALFARMMNPVAAYNLLVLLTFPLSAATAYALARYLTGSHPAALIAGFAFMLAPFHVAQAAYHPHIAQTEWLPLYFLGLFALVDRPSVWRAAGLAAACGALVLSNDYGGLIGAVTTPVALVSYWWASPRAPRSLSRLAVAAATLAGIAALGLLAILRVAPPLIVTPGRFAFPLDDVGWYSARWWAYIVPPVDHAWLGTPRLFKRFNVTLGLLENQLDLGWGLLTLSAIALVTALRRWRTVPEGRPIVALAVTALVATFISTGPWSGTCQGGSLAPACLLYRVAPMFRSYARFGVATSMVVAIAAGAGSIALARRSAWGVAGAGALLILGAFEYLPLPWRAHDVLPTAGHRWLASQPLPQRTLDCLEPDAANASVGWLMQRDVSYLNDAIPTCSDPALAPTLAALGFTDVLVRHSYVASPLVGALDGLTLVASFSDSSVYRVTANAPPVITIGRPGFSDLEQRGDDFWRWMGPTGRWRVLNPTQRTWEGSLSVLVTSAGQARTLTMTVDGGAARTVWVGIALQRSVVGPWSLTPGMHTVDFAASGPPVRPSATGESSDDRALTMSFRNERWIAR